jgi:hypothetical protein
MALRLGTVLSRWDFNTRGEAGLFCFFRRGVSGGAGAWGGASSSIGSGVSGWRVGADGQPFFPMLGGQGSWACVATCNHSNARQTEAHKAAQGHSGP